MYNWNNEKYSSKSLIPFIYSVDEQTFIIIKSNYWAQVIRPSIMGGPSPI
jgi:hypothetical protein